MRLTNVFGLALSLSVVSLCHGQATNRVVVTGYPVSRTVAMSLDEAVRLALEHNLTLQIQRYQPAIMAYDVKAAYGSYYDPTFNAQWRRADVTQEGGGFNPTTGLQTPPTRQQVDTLSGTLNGRLPTGMTYELYNDIEERLFNRPFFDTNSQSFLKTQDNYWVADAGIRVTQPLLRNFWTDAGRTSIKLAKQDKKIEILRVESLAQGLVSDVARNYFELLGTLESIKVAEADLQVKMQFLNEMKRRVEVGSKTQLDETKASAAVAQARSDLRKALDASADAEATLKSRISDNYANQIGVQLKPTDKLLLVPSLIDFPTSVETALDKRPEVVRERAAVERQDIQLKYNFNQLFPRLDVFASWGVDGLDDHLSGAINDLDHMDYQRDTYGALLNFPLTFWKERANYNAQKLAKAQELLTLKAMEEGVIRNVDDAIRGVSSGYERALLARESVIAAEQDLDAQQKRYAAGKATSFEVLDSASKLTAARNSEIQAIVDYNVAQSELLRAEGTALESRKIDFEMAHRPDSIRNRK